MSSSGRYRTVKPNSSDLKPQENKPASKPQTISTIQWASRVVGVSSEKKGEPYGEQYKASQALGRPSKLPEIGESPCAWAPFYADGTADEWIQVGFAKPMRARQIVIAENVNPGAVVKVIAYRRKGSGAYRLSKPPAFRPETRSATANFPERFGADVSAGKSSH